METVRGRTSTEVMRGSPERIKVVSRNGDPPYYNNNVHHNQQIHHPRDRSVKNLFTKVQVVYYLTRNGQLEHPHYLEVTHLAIQPLRLKDVIDRLTVLRGKAMPCRYSWSCKRSYKNGYVWNDLTENDVIYASEGSEYVLKGSELIQETEFPEIETEDVQKKLREQRKGTQVRPLVTNKSCGEHSFRQSPVNNFPKPQADGKCGRSNVLDHDDDDNEEEKGSCESSSDAPYHKPSFDDCQLVMQTEQDESYSLPSTSSTNSDKPAQQQQAINPAASTMVKLTAVDKYNQLNPPALSRNTAFLQLIACGGGSIVSKAKSKSEIKTNKNFNFDSMRSTLIPCLKHQLSTRAGNFSNTAANTTTASSVAQNKGAAVGDQRVENHDRYRSQVADEDDEDMIMVRYMSENPRFGNLQSEEKEYFSGTIIEAMNQHNHTHFASSSSALQGHSQPLAQPPVLNKCSSYNEQRNCKQGLQIAGSEAADSEEEKEKTSISMRGIIKCMPRKKREVSKSNNL